MQEIYVSTDVEADGPIPGPPSMLSLGSAAFTAVGELLSTFSANLELLEGAAGHPTAMDWSLGLPAVGSGRYSGLAPGFDGCGSRTPEADVPLAAQAWGDLSGAVRTERLDHGFGDRKEGPDRSGA